MSVSPFWPFSQTACNDRFHYPFTYFNQRNPYSFIYLKHGKDTPFGRNLPVWAIIGITPPPPTRNPYVFLQMYLKPEKGNHFRWSLTVQALRASGGPSLIAFNRPYLSDILSDSWLFEPNEEENERSLLIIRAFSSGLFFFSVHQVPKRLDRVLLMSLNCVQLLQEFWPTSLWTRLRDSPRGLPLIFEDEFQAKLCQFVLPGLKDL